MNEIIKECKKHGVLYQKNVRLRKGKKEGTFRYECLNCVREGNKRSYQRHKESYIARNLRYTQLNKDKIKKIRDRIRAKNRLQMNEQWKMKQRNNCENLSDEYIKKILSRFGNLKYKDIPNNLVSIKKALLKLKRKIKENK